MLISSQRLEQETRRNILWSSSIAGSWPGSLVYNKFQEYKIRCEEKKKNEIVKSGEEIDSQ